MTLRKQDVCDLARTARSIPAVVRDERYSGFGRASIAIERANCVALGLECIAADMPDDTAPAELPAPSGPPHPSVPTLGLEALRYEPQQCNALLQIEHLPAFVLALLGCRDVPPERHAPAIAAYIGSLIEAYQKGQPQ